MEKDQTIQSQAKAYARATTHTRCLRMGECEECQVRYCDFRSRVEAYTVGYHSAKSENNNIQL